MSGIEIPVTPPGEGTPIKPGPGTKPGGLAPTQPPVVVGSSPPSSAPKPKAPTPAPSETPAAAPLAVPGVQHILNVLIHDVPGYLTRTNTATRLIYQTVGRGR